LISVTEVLGVKSALEIGWGNGDFEKLVAVGVYDIVACDSDDSALRIAQAE
jgi:ribosomal protein L11 methylase PrmA